MAVVSRVWIVLAACGLLLGCRSSSVGGDFAGHPTGMQYYTQYALQYEKGKHPTTNYRQGALLPINSRVTFVAGNSKQLKLTLENGSELIIQNVPKHTGESMEQAFDKLLGTSPVDMSRFSLSEQESIQRGQVRLGMSRDAVLAAIGYPPITGTPTLDQPVWKYSASRWKSFLVVFDNQWRVVECPE